MPTRCPKGSRRRAPPTCTVYNPIGFDPAEVLPPHLHRYADHARFFLPVLYAQQVSKDLKDEFVPLKAVYLRRFFPSNDIYKQLRDALVDSGTVVCDGEYRQADSSSRRNLDGRYRGGKCYGYKLGPGWEGVRHERVTLTTRTRRDDRGRVGRSDSFDEVVYVALRQSLLAHREVVGAHAGLEVFDGPLRPPGDRLASGYGLRLFPFQTVFHCDRQRSGKSLPP